MKSGSEKIWSTLVANTQLSQYTPPSLPMEFDPLVRASPARHSRENCVRAHISACRYPSTVWRCNSAGAGLRDFTPSSTRISASLKRFQSRSSHLSMRTTKSWVIDCIPLYSVPVPAGAVRWTFCAVDVVYRVLKRAGSIVHP